MYFRFQALRVRQEFGDRKLPRNVKVLDMGPRASADRTHATDTMPRVLGRRSAEDKLPGGIVMRNLNAITPESERTCHYFWAQAHNFLLDRPLVTDMLFEQIDTAFRQDWEVFELRQPWIDLDPAGPRVDVNGDAGQIQSIRMLRERIAEEQRATKRQAA
jgi:hypothetical protein